MEMGIHINTILIIKLGGQWELGAEKSVLFIVILHLIKGYF